VKTYKTVRTSVQVPSSIIKTESKNCIRLPRYNSTNKDIYIVITCLIGLTGEVSAGAQLPPRNNSNDDKTS
jgi:hypothetical protein